MILDYVVIILNYNSSEYIRKAINTIRECSTGVFRICVVDNNSPREGEKEILLELKNEHDIEVLLLNSNEGYGSGNNRAFQYMKSKYSFKYTVIMNPDIELIESGTIEKVIKGVEENGAVGGQPLVWNCYYGNDPEVQINIGKAVNYWGLCVISSVVLRCVFRNYFNKLVFINEMPYKKHIEYDVPSGAFFIIRTDVFQEISGFDDETFLYGEESILGYKLSVKGYHMVLCPEYVVKHLQGVSTGYDRYSWDKKRLEYIQQSRKVYMKKYLKCGKIKINIMIFILWIDYVMRKIYVQLKRGLKCIK